MFYPGLTGGFHGFLEFATSDFEGDGLEVSQNFWYVVFLECLLPFCIHFVL